MYSEPRIETLKEKQLAGNKLRMSFVNNRTGELWRGFMPLRNSFMNVVGNDLYSVEVYGAGFFLNFDPDKEFEKWAAVEVSDTQKLPPGIELLTVPEGLYAAFFYKGRANEGEVIYRYIHNQWLPASDYELDNRPHFALMGAKYKNDDPESEEEIWIPIREKGLPH
ncbi:MAG: GyrI-like domain-containing protein [Bacteroidetes bacterium]|nr:GyrI-like domain-containing protein [Bacteroidota bacterium]